jgi:flagellar hook assembly protein FlgD
MNLHGISTINPVAHMYTNLSMGGAGSTAATTPSSSAGSSTPAGAPTDPADQAESTFISLLVTELQSQDPTQPMDPTAMVGQMFSMNQLEQLININQTLTTAFGPLTGAAAAVAPATGGTTSSPNPVLTGAI